MSWPDAGGRRDAAASHPQPMPPPPPSVPLTLVYSILAQAQALLEATALGQRLQQLAELRVTHASCGNDLAPLADALAQQGALCGWVARRGQAPPPSASPCPFASISDTVRLLHAAALAPGTAPQIGAALAAHRRAEAALAAQQADALAALASLGGQLARQALESGDEARQLAQQPLSLELVRSWVAGVSVFMTGGLFVLAHLCCMGGSVSRSAMRACRCACPASYLDAAQAQVGPAGVLVLHHFGMLHEVPVAAVSSLAPHPLPAAGLKGGRLLALRFVVFRVNRGQQEPTNK